MTIFERVKKLGFPLGQYVVVGGAMEAHGLRPAKDIDIIAMPELISKLLAEGWKETGCWNCPGCGRLFLEKEDVDVISDFSHGDKYRADTRALISSADIIEGVPFVRLEELVKWKKAAGRPKDLVDVEMIEKYLDAVNH
jgi:hypothetical protein